MKIRFTKEDQRVKIHEISLVTGIAKGIVLKLPEIERVRLEIREYGRRR
jgi:hypothetical protein